jgi:hypothetical protein
MEDALKEKLTRVLNSPIETEEQVVYFFVELRKLMERSKTLKDKYPTVNLYCNWVVHTELDRSSLADEIVRKFDLGYGQKQNPKIIAELNDLLTTERLKTELTRCLVEEFKLPAIDVSNLKKWNRFRHSLAMVITDCPLSIKVTKKSAPTQFVECVSVSATIETNGTASIAWQVTRKGEKNPTIVSASLLILDPEQVFFRKMKKAVSE